MTERVVLAYSGGLDTSVAIGWIAEQTGAEVIALAVDVGQGGEDLDTIRKRALACGAADAEVADVRDGFAAGYCMPALRANALYMDRYPLVSALSRPLIVKRLARVARRAPPQGRELAVDQVPGRSLGMPVLLAIARQDGPAHALPGLAARVGVVAVATAGCERRGAAQPNNQRREPCPYA